MSINIIKYNNLDTDYEWKIPLRNKNKEIINYALVDEVDYENVMKYKWNCNYKITCFNNYTYYEVLGWVNKKTIKLSHFIYGKPSTNMVVDHINKNTFDNRRKNLTESTKNQNGQNKKKTTKKTTSIYIGVSYNKRSKKWQSKSCNKNLGLFDNEIDAAISYDKYVLIKFGKNASTNNLVKYKEIINLTEDDILVKKKSRDLPDNICMRNKSFLVVIKYKELKFKKQAKTLEEAKIILKKCKDEINKKKENELLMHNQKEITRDSENNAIILLYDSNNNNIGSTIVDDNKWHHLSLYTWRLNNDYIVGRIDNNDIRLNRYLLGVSNDLVVDHYNNNKLDNRIKNLRPATPAQNTYNKSPYNTSTTGYKGVSKIKNKETFTANICKNGERYYLGVYKYAIEAAIAYNLIAEFLFKDFAYLNKINIEKNEYEKYKIEIITKMKKMTVGKLF
jgi:hypothetical protein